MDDLRDKHKDNGILLAQSPLIKLSKEVISMAESNPELLNSVYKEISEKLGVDTAMEIYRMFKGQQISFPMRFFLTLRAYSNAFCRNTMAQTSRLWQSSTATQKKR